MLPFDEISQISQKIWPRSTSFLFGQTKSMNSLQKDPRLGAGNSSSVDSRSDFKVLPENGLRVRGRRQRRVEVTHRVFKKGLTEKVKLCSGRRWVWQKNETRFFFLGSKKARNRRRWSSVPPPSSSTSAKRQKNPPPPRTRTPRAT